MNWSFAIINNQLGEIYFEKSKNDRIKFLGHCYVKREEFKTKQEQRWINEDIKKVRIVYRNKKYKLISPKNMLKNCRESE